MVFDLNILMFLVAVLAGVMAFFIILAASAASKKTTHQDIMSQRLATLMDSEIENDDYDMPEQAEQKVTWNSYWLKLYKKTGRVPEDDATPGRIPLVIGGVLGAFGFLVYPGDVFGLFVGLGIGLYAPYAWLNFEVKRRARTLDKQLPQLLNSLRSNIQGGYTPDAAIKQCADEIPAPLGDELKKVRDDTKVNIPMIEALQRMSERIDSPDIKFMLAAIEISLTEGSSLDEQLEIIQGISRQRVRIQQRLAAAVANVKPTLYVAGFVIPASLVFSIYSSPQNKEFWFSFMGIIGIVVVAALYGIGLFATHKLVKNVENT